jgi:lipopolysaccharide biosynthesis regulator YciM
VLEGGPRRLPFNFSAHAGVGRLVLTQVGVGPIQIERLELEVSDLGTDPGPVVAAERFQRRRTRLSGLQLRIQATALGERVEAARRHLAGLGITQVHARLGDGFLSVRARAADGLATADLSFRVQLVCTSTQLRALASHIRVHGHLPTPGPVIADRILAALLGATDTAGVVERPRVRGLCDVEIDAVGAVLWHVLPASGWRLPAITEIEAVHLRVTRSAIEIAFGPSGTRAGELGVRPSARQLAAAHDLMHSVDQQLRSGHVEEAMRGYRALLAAGGPDQPHLLERILALASARPPWFFDGLELARQALSRWPHFPAANAALAAITLAQGDAREAASQLTQLAQLGSSDGDDDQATLAALAGARLLRVLEPRAATQLYELALEHDPGSVEAADALADRLADEQRWVELVRLLRARAVSSERDRALALRLRLADVIAHQLGDPAGAQQELGHARDLAPEDPAVHEMAAVILATSDRAGAVTAWREVARLAEARGDHHTAARAYAALGELLSADGTHPEAETAWRRALELDPLQADATAGLAVAAAERGDHATATELYERLRGLGLPQLSAARHELQLARSLVQLGRNDEARAALRRTVLVGGELAAEAHAMLAEIAEATADREHAAAELDTAISSLVGLADEAVVGDRLYARAAELAVARATLLDRSGAPAQATAEWERAYDLAAAHAPEIARDAARTMLQRAGDAAGERRWIDAVLATRPPPAERAFVLVQRAEVRRRELTPDLAAAVADLHEALERLDAIPSDDDTAATRRRAYQLEAELMAQSGDQRARAQALTALAKLADRSAERVEVETAAATAWLAANEPALALPHGARAHAAIVGGELRSAGIPEPGSQALVEVSPELRRDVLTTLGEAAWRQRAWPDVIRAYNGLVAEASSDQPGVLGLYRYRLAVAAERTGDGDTALAVLRPLVEDADATRTTTGEARGPALRLFADLAERTGDLVGAASALEGFGTLAVDSSGSARADAMYRAGELFWRAAQAGESAGLSESMTRAQRDDAVRCLEGALRISETHLPALDALEQAWRERGDLERVSVILGRKVAATARHPQRQKPLLSRLGDLQEQLGRPDVALATHKRALEIDPTWRPSLRFVTVRQQESGELAVAAQGLAHLVGELPGDSGLDLAIVARERQLAAKGLAQLVAELDDTRIGAVRDAAASALERVHAAGTELDFSHVLARLRGEPAPRPIDSIDEQTPNGRVRNAPAGALSLRDAANRARAAGKFDEAFASLEAANHVSPGDEGVLRELVELAEALDDHGATARHLIALAAVRTGKARADTLLLLADVYYDKLDDATRARIAMSDAAEAFGRGARRDATLRLLASEAASHLAWDAAAHALAGIETTRRTASDIVQLATALARAGKLGDAVKLLEEGATRVDDGGTLIAELRAEVERKAELARTLEWRARGAATAAEASTLRSEANALWASIGREPDDLPPRTEPPPNAPTPSAARTTEPPPAGDAVREGGRTSKPGTWPPATELRPPSPPAALARKVIATLSQNPAPSEPEGPSVTVTGSAEEKEAALRLAAASADRERLLIAHRASPDDPALLLALLAHLGDREPKLRREILDKVAESGHARAQAIALHELALAARAAADPIRAAALWNKGHRIDPSYAPLWMPLADALASADEIALARDLYEQIAESPEFDSVQRKWAAQRASALSRDDSVVSGEIRARRLDSVPDPDLENARELADKEDWAEAIAAAERAAAANPSDVAALELLERLYLEESDLTRASEAIGRQIVITEQPLARARLWRRRAKLYRDALGRDAEAYRCLKEAHACAPADPEIAYQLRTAAMVRGEWALAASLLYREIAAATSPRDRGALHVELALIYEERLNDAAQALVNYEQALVFDPTIPAARAPLARRYEAIGRYGDAARLYDEAATYARAADRAALLADAARCRASIETDRIDTDVGKLERAIADGDVEAALEFAQELWRAEPGHPTAFRVLSRHYRAQGDLTTLTDLVATGVHRIELPVERATAWLEAARLAEELGKLPEASRAYDLALIEEPGHAGALDARGALAFKLGDWATADLIYRDLGPNETALGADELALRRSIVAEKIGRDREALAFANDAVEVAPGRRDLHARVQGLATRLGELEIALTAARTVLELVPLDDTDTLLATQFTLIELHLARRDLDAAVLQLEKIVRDHPHHAGALEQLADIYVAKGDWRTATRYLYQLVPLAPSARERAERLYRLGEAMLLHLGDVDRADDVFLRASDLDPSHVPTLRRLLDVYWRADDPAALVEVATELASNGALDRGPTLAGSALAQALVAAALVGETGLAAHLMTALGDDAHERIASVLGELGDRRREGSKLQLASATTAIAELGRRGLIDVHKLRVAASGTPVEQHLAG